MTNSKRKWDKVLEDMADRRRETEIMHQSYSQNRGIHAFDRGLKANWA